MSIEARRTAFNAFVSACQSAGVGANKAPEQASGSGKESESISVWALKRRTTSTSQPPAPPDNFDSWVEYHAYFNAWTLRKLVLYYLAVAWWSTLLSVHTLTALTHWPAKRSTCRTLIRGTDVEHNVKQADCCGLL